METIHYSTKGEVVIGKIRARLVMTRTILDAPRLDVARSIVEGHVLIMGTEGEFYTSEVLAAEYKGCDITPLIYAKEVPFAEMLNPSCSFQAWGQFEYAPRSEKSFCVSKTVRFNSLKVQFKGKKIWIAFRYATYAAGFTPDASMAVFPLLEEVQIDGIVLENTSYSKETRDEVIEVITDAIWNHTVDDVRISDTLDSHQIFQKNKPS